MTRNDFRTILEATVVPGNVSQKEMNSILQPMLKAIMDLMPKKLYRYRSTNSYNIDALRKDLVYTVTANRFNDPYDTLFQINLPEIDSLINATANVSFLRLLKSMILSNQEPQILKTLPCEEHKRIVHNLLNADLSDEVTINDQFKVLSNIIINFINTSTSLIYPVIQTSATYACFSERVDSLTMWSHYSQNHKGFVLGYPKQKFSFDEVFKINSEIYPVVYSNERFDGNNLFAWTIYKLLGIPVNEFDKLAHIKASLHKSTDWAYENEWRLINFTPTQNREKPEITPVKIKPTEIYYGVKIPYDDKLTLHDIASEKGLKEYDMYIDNNSSRYALNFRPTEWK